MPATDLTLTLIQTTLHWHDAAANRAHFSELIKGIDRPTDLIVLPEMFTTGFSMEAAALAEEMDGSSMDWLREQARQTGAVVAGSLIIKEEGRFYNRLIWMRPDGSFARYDKRHLFRMAHEEQTYTPGQERLQVTLKDWQVCPLVCYDLRFPVWSRNTSSFDLLLYVANWPERRSLAWRTLLQARAIENLCYVAGVNRVGTDGNGIAYSGDSAVFGPAGEPLFARANEPCVQTLTLSAEELRQFRERFPAHLDADRFTLQP